jgi:putative membrane protein
MTGFWENQYVQLAGYYSIATICIIICLAIFELVTSYRNWDEIKKGNMAVAMATGGKIFGIANVFRHSILHNDSVLTMAGWGIFGFILLLIGYFMFEFLTPSFNVDKEIERDNRAVGFISFVISAGLSYMIGAALL